MGSSFVGTPIYQWIFEQGRLDGVIDGRLNEARRFVLRQGIRRFGAPAATARAVIETTQDIDQLEIFAERVPHPGVHDWYDVLPTT